MYVDLRVKCLIFCPILINLEFLIDSLFWLKIANIEFK
jgi:hypothetical protein